MENKLETVESEFDNYSHSYVFVYLGIAKPFPIYPIDNEQKLLAVDFSGLIDDSLLEEFDWGEVLTMGKGQYGVLFSIKRIASEKQIYISLYKVAHRLQSKVMTNNQVVLSVLTSSIFDDIGKLLIVSRRLEQASKYSVFYGKDKIVSELEIEEAIKTEPPKEIDRDGLKDAIMKMSKDGIRDSLAMMFDCDDILHNSIQSLKMISKQLTSALDELRKQYKLLPIYDGINLSIKDYSQWYNINDIRKWFVNKFISTIEEIEIIKSQQYSPKILMTLEYIKKKLFKRYSD